MRSARTLVAARLAFACAVVFAIASAPPDAARLFASFARHGADARGAGVGWLGAALTNGLYDGPLRYGALVGISVLAALIAFVAIERRARQGASAAGAFAAVVLAALCALDSLHAGGGAATLLFAATVVLLLERASFASALALGSVTIVWCNVEAAGLLAPAFALVSALGRSCDDAKSPAAQRAWLAAAIATCATFATPLRFAYPAHALAALQLAGSAADYALWSPPDVSPHAYRYGVTLAIVVALAVGLRGRTTRDALLAAFAFVIALANGAFVAVFGIVAAPIVVAAFARRTAGEPSAGPRFTPASAVGTLASAVALALVAAFATGARTLPLAPGEPYAAVARLARTGNVHRVYCAELGWCDAALANGLPVVADGRIANAPQRVRDVQIAIARGRKSWRTKLDALRVDAAVASADSSLATLLTELHWTRFATAGSTVILRRRIPAS